MYDPKFRFTFLISLLVAIATVEQIITTFFWGASGLNFQQYLKGIGLVGATSLGGFIFTWIGVQIISFEKNKKTGFEPTFMDETGTGFNFPVSLSKFLPDIIAQPQAETFHPLEAELLGFLNGFHHWPTDLHNPTAPNLYEAALTQWKAMQSLPNITPYHRIAALAQHLGVIYAFKETRKTHPLSQFWEKDKLSYKKRCDPHGGIASFILSTMPSFRKLHTDKTTNQILRRALLTAVRYVNNHSGIPHNCDPLAKDIFEALHKARQKVEGNTGTFNPSEEDTLTLQKEIESYLQGIIKELNLTPEGVTDIPEGLSLGGGNVLIHLPNFIQRIGSVLSPATKGAFQLWEVPADPDKHPATPAILQALRTLKTLEDTLGDLTSDNGLWHITVDGIPFPSILIKVDASMYPELRRLIDATPRWNGTVAPLQAPPSATTATSGNNAVETELSGLRKAVEMMSARLQALYA